MASIIKLKLNQNRLQIYEYTLARTECIFPLGTSLLHPVNTPVGTENTKPGTKTIRDPKPILAGTGKNQSHPIPINPQNPQVLPFLPRITP